jgi:hypothetical protein
MPLASSPIQIRMLAFVEGLNPGVDLAVVELLEDAL